MSSVWVVRCVGGILFVYSIFFTYNTSGVLFCVCTASSRGAQGQSGDAYEIAAGDFVSRDFVLWRGGEVVSSSVFSRFLWKWVAVQSGFNALLFVVVVAAWRGGIFCWWKDFFLRRRRRRRISQDEWLRGFQAGAADGAFHKTGSWREGKWDLCRCRRGEGRK